jgi:hypothetical protein
MRAKRVRPFGSEEQKVEEESLLSDRFAWESNQVEEGERELRRLFVKSRGRGRGIGEGRGKSEIPEINLIRTSRARECCGSWRVRDCRQRMRSEASDGRRRRPK